MMGVTGNVLPKYLESDEDAHVEDETDDDDNDDDESSTERLSDVDQPMNAKIDQSRSKDTAKPGVHECLYDELLNVHFSYIFMTKWCFNFNVF